MLSMFQHAVIVHVSCIELLCLREGRDRGTKVRRGWGRMGQG
jgi:hypothetical protein